MVEKVMTDDWQSSDDFFGEKPKRISQFDVVELRVYPHPIAGKGISNHTVWFVETRPKFADIEGKDSDGFGTKGRQSKYFVPYNNLNPANLLNCEIYLDEINVSNSWRNDILKQFARMKNAWMQTFVQTLKEQADIGGKKLGRKQKVMDESLFEFKIDPAVVQRFVDDMRLTEKEKEEKRKEAKKLKKAPPRYFVLPEGCLRITTGEFADTNLQVQFNAFLKKFYPLYFQKRTTTSWKPGESMARARQLFTARYRAAFFEAVHIATELTDAEIDLKMFRKDHKGLVDNWESVNMPRSEMNNKIRAKLKVEKAHKAWAQLPTKGDHDQNIRIYGAPLPNPYLVCGGANAFLVRE